MVMIWNVLGWATVYYDVDVLVCWLNVVPMWGWLVEWWVNMCATWLWLLWRLGWWGTSVQMQMADLLLSDLVLCCLGCDAFCPMLRSALMGASCPAELSCCEGWADEALLTRSWWLIRFLSCCAIGPLRVHCVGLLIMELLCDGLRWCWCWDCFVLYMGLLATDFDA